jgi:hypothetical protein
MQTPPDIINGKYYRQYTWVHGLCWYNDPPCKVQVLKYEISYYDVGDGFFLAIIAAQDELEFDAYGRAPLGLSDRWLSGSNGAIIQSFALLLQFFREATCYRVAYRANGRSPQEEGREDETRKFVGNATAPPLARARAPRSSGVCTASGPRPCMGTG